MKIVGLTGGIGSGKSTVAKMFKDLGVAIYDSDKSAKELMTHSKILKGDIVKLLGEDAYKNDQLNREYIAKQVFGNSGLLEKLSKIVHPAVREHFLKWAQQQDSPYVIQESALIFENGNEDVYDAIVLITAPVDIRVRRVIKRDGTQEGEVLKRIEHQMEDTDKKERAHFLIENIDLETTQNKVLEIHNTLVNSN